MDSEEKTLKATTPPDEAANYDPEAIVIPDGGLEAWLSILGGWMVVLCTFGYASSFGVYQDYYTVAGTSTASNISWIGSLQLFLLFFVGLPAGRLFDLGYFHHTSIFGSLLYVFSMFMLSLANPHKYYQLVLAQGIGMGLGGGLLLVPAMSIQAHHWKKRRSFAMGIVLTGSGFGGVIYPIMLNQLFNSSVGFAWGVRASAFLTLGLLVVANCIMRTRLPSAKDRPADPNAKPAMNVIITDTAFMLAVLGNFLVLWGVYFPYFYLQLWVNLHGLSTTLAFYTIAILNAGSIVGRTVPNHIADKVGQFNVLWPITAITGCLVFAMYGAKSTGAVIVFSILYGFFSGAYIALLAPTVAAMARDLSEIGLRLGVAYFLTSFAMLTGTPIVGALVGTKVDWSRGIVFSGVVILVGAGIVCIARHLFARRKGTQRV